jgi:AbrB family looped-hinge helix DNA binding protein
MKQRARMRINENGRVVIPAEFRKRLGIRPGDQLELRVEDQELRISTLR